MSKIVRFLFIGCLLGFMFTINGVVFAENAVNNDYCADDIKNVLIIKEEKTVNIALDGPCMTSGEFKYVIQKDNTAVIVEYTGKESTVSIPSDMDGHCVSAIGPCAFNGHGEIKKIFMWADPIYIGKSAFKGCTGLESIKIPLECMLIDSSAFEDCRGMNTVTLEGDPDIADRAFYGCVSLEEIEIGAGTKIIGKSAFEDCNSLYKVVIWGNTEIGNRAFFGCNKLRSVILFGGDAEIGSEAFYNCPNLNKINFWKFSEWKPSDKEPENHSDKNDMTKDSSPEITEDTDMEEDADEIESPEMTEDTDEIEENGLIDGMRPEFKEAMDSYEEFYNSYYDLLKKYENNPADLTLLTEYMNMLEKAEKMEESLEAWDEDEMNDAELAYYLDVTNRILKKAADI